MSEKTLSLSQLEAIDAIVDRFEDRWESGPTADLSEFLDQLNESDIDVRRALLIELIAIDLDQRWRRSATNDKGQAEADNVTFVGNFPDKPLVEHYTEAFPELTGADGLAADLIAAEVRARRRSGDAPSLEEYQQRFPESIATIAPSLYEVPTWPLREPRLPGNTGRNDTLVSRDNAGSRPRSAGRFGDYLIESEVAAGGMGVVYRARHTQLNRSVALKMIKSGEVASEEEIKRFRTEAEAAANLHHPNIVSVYEVGELDGQHYYSMNFVDGQCLSDLVQEGPLAQKIAVTICEKTALAVAHAHAHGIVHRDLKPGNILLDGEGEPQVTDFGLAKKVEGESDLTMSGQILGTPRFMSPEQAEGRPDVGPLADVYALGAILYYCLTGRAPFQAATVVDTLMQVREQEPVSPRTLNPEVDRDLETICLKCLQKDPTRRYASATALTEDLRRWQSHEPILARPVSPTELLFKWCQRRPATAAAVAACIIAMFALGALISAASYNDELTAALDNSRKAEAVTQSALNDLDVQQGKTQAAFQNLKVQQGKTAEALEAANAANAEARRLSYYRKVALAMEEWESGNASAARALIYQTQDGALGWEWHYLNRQYITQVDRGRFRILPQATPNSELVVTPFAEQQAVANLGAQSVVIYDLLQNQSVATWTSPEVSVKALSRDSKFVVGFHPSQSIARIWRFQTGELLRTIDFAEEIGPSFTTSDATFTNNSDVILVRLQDFTRNQTKLIRWNWESGEVQSTIELAGVQQNPHQVKNTICLSADDTFIVVANWHNQVLLLDAERGMEMHRIDTSETISVEPIHGLQLADDATRLATIHSGIVAIWDTTNGEILHQLRHPDNILEVAFDPDGNWIASGGVDRIVRVWELETGRLLTDFRGHHAPVVEVQVSSDGDTLFSLDSHGYVQRWGLDAGHQEFLEYSLPFAIEKVEVTGHGSMAYASGVNQVAPPSPQAAIIRTDHRDVTLIPFGSPFRQCLSVSRDGQTLATSAWGRLIQLRDPQSGEAIVEFGEHRPGAMNLELNHDGSAVIAGCYHTGTEPGRIVVWDVKSQTQRFEKQFSGNVWDVAAFPDENLCMASVVHPGTGSQLVVLNIESGESLIELELKDRVDTLAISPSGDRYAIASVAQTIEIRSYPDHALLHELQSEGVAAWDMAFTPDGRRLAAVTVSGVTIYDADYGTRVVKLHHPSCRCLAFSNDGFYLATGSANGTLRIWDASP